MKIGVLNIGIGNIGSLGGALSSLGYDPILVTKSAQFNSIDRLILPGVGSFFNAMDQVKLNYFDCAIKEFAWKGKPILGICLGMQILANHGNEGGLKEGLGLIEGEVKILRTTPEFKLPHVGWNSLDLKIRHPLFDGIKNGVDFYFVHSYFFDVAYKKNVVSETSYSQDFASVVSFKNIVGTQFHPEKSQKNGLKLLENFCEWDGSC